MKVLLIIRRFAAFGIDWLVFVLASLPIALYFWFAGLDPRAMSRIQTMLLWAWLAYFILFEWLYAATVGKFIMRLAVKRVDGTGLSLVTAVSRTGLSFLIPCVLSVFTPSNLFFNSSQLGGIAAMALSTGVLAVLPISILVLGGQSIADVLLHTNVVPVGADTARQNIGKNRWIFIVTLSLLVGVFFSWTIGLSSQLMYGTNNMTQAEKRFFNSFPSDLIDTSRMPNQNQRFTVMTDIRGTFVRQPHQKTELGRSLTETDMYGNADSFDELMVMRRVAFYMSELPDDQRPDCMPVKFQKEFDAVLTGFRQQHEMVVCDVPKGSPEKATLIDRGMGVSLEWKLDVTNMLILLVGRSGEDITRFAPMKRKEH